MIYLNKNFKQLVIYYSQNGNTRYLSQNISSHLQTDILEIKLLEQKKTILKNKFNFILNIFAKLPDIENFTVDISKYDLIYIGSPIWNKNFSPAVISLISKINLIDKKIALFCTYKNNAGNSFNNIKKKLKDSLIVGEIAIQEPLSFGKTKELFKDKIINWASLIAKTVRDGLKIEN